MRVPLPDVRCRSHDLGTVRETDNKWQRVRTVDATIAVIGGMAERSTGFR
jgi:hypothetical protein